MKWKPRNEAEHEAADKAVSFITALKHTKGRWAGVPFNLRPWQEEGIIRPLFGTLNEDGTRRHRTAYIEIPRKNGKSELAAAIALKLLFKDGEMGAQIYGAASDRDQATIVFNVAAAMVRKNPTLAARCKIIDSQKRIVRHDVGSFYRAIPADAAGSHGFDASGIVFDELHTQPNRELWDVLTTSTGSRSQPLTFAITTAGYDRNSIWWELHDYAEKVEKGLIDDPTWFVFIRGMRTGEDWRSEKVWRRVNPALGDFRSLEEMRSLARRAKYTPALQNTFRRLYGNDPNTQQSDRWIDLSLWDANARIVDEVPLKGRECYGALDVATVNDLTSWTMVFPDGDKMDVISRFWCPEARLRDSGNRYRDQYQVWADKGFLTVTPGTATDFHFVKAQIQKDATDFNLQEMGIDPWQGHHIGMELAEEGIRVIEMRQGFQTFAAPMTELMRRLLAHLVNHGGNPVLRWMADNCAVKQDPAGNLKPDKSSSQGKIDGIVTLVMALGRLLDHEDKNVAWAAV